VDTVPDLAQRYRAEVNPLSYIGGDVEKVEVIESQGYTHELHLDELSLSWQSCRWDAPVCGSGFSQHARFF
jgi:hypothetical protein